MTLMQINTNTCIWCASSAPLLLGKVIGLDANKAKGNIYTVTKLILANGSTKLLVASLKREVFHFEYLDGPNGVLIPTTKEVSFTYIPSGAEIISIDAFNKSETTDEFVIGITIIKNSSDLNRLELEAYLNIYSESEECKDFSIENIAQNCLNVELNFIPYHLTHTWLVTWTDDEVTSKEIVFVLTGSDNRIHIYKENTSNHIYKELDKKELFPEFGETPSVVIWIDILYFNNYSERLTAIGCECGLTKISRVNVKTNDIIYSHSTRLHNYITSLRIYPETSTLQLQESEPVLNVIVVNSILPPVIFSNVLKNGMKKCSSLPRVDMMNVFTCLDVVDIDFDVNKEILIGNSAEEILLYKHLPDKGWYLSDLKRVTGPVMSITSIDVTGDGIKELIVLTMKGVHILQHEHSVVERALINKITKLTLEDLMKYNQKALLFD